MIMEDDFQLPAVNSDFSTLRGFVRWNFSRYRISPRDAKDLVAD